MHSYKIFINIVDQKMGSLQPNKQQTEYQIFLINRCGWYFFWTLLQRHEIHLCQQITTATM